MSKTIIITAIITAIFTAIAAVVAVLGYLDEKPRLSAVGEYATWTTPPDRDLGGFESYAQIDLRNVGNAVAKDIKVQTPFSGILAIDGKKIESGEFEKNFSLQDLNPGEGHLLKIWARNSVSDYFLDVNITHTRGTASVDFGYKTKGIVGWISKSLDIFWASYILIFLLAASFLANYIHELKTKKPMN